MALGQQPVRFGYQRGVVMAEEERAVATHEIEHRDFPAIAVVIQVVSLPPVEHHANAQQVEQPTELRLDRLVEVIRHGAPAESNRSMPVPESLIPIPNPLFESLSFRAGCVWRNAGRDISWVAWPWQGRVRYAGAHTAMVQDRGGPFDTLESAYEFVSLLRE